MDGWVQFCLALASVLIPGFVFMLAAIKQSKATKDNTEISIYQKIDILNRTIQTLEQRLSTCEEKTRTLLIHNHELMSENLEFRKNKNE